ncbi:MAG: 2-dehydro-3-deoxy-D-gluconate 5-dehydrogenase KduD [Lachnospirales bacterium]
MFNLNNKVAIVTGARTGLGQGVALELAKAGADIVCVGSTKMDETVEKITKLGRKVLFIQADLTKTDKIQEIVDSTVKEFGHIDILVNNAGTIRRNDSVDFTEKDWDDVMNLNLKTLFFLSQKVAKQFILQGNGGKIINIASLLSYQGGIRVPSYTASKGGVKTLTMLMSNEWAKHNINANAIAPGYMVTDNTEALRNDEQRASEILGRIPAGRWGTPEDIGGTAVFLASSASDYINGFTIAVDGGWLGR